MVSVILKTALKLKPPTQHAHPRNLSHTSPKKFDAKNQIWKMLKIRVVYPLVLSGGLGNVRYGFNPEKNSLIDGGSISEAKNCAGLPSTRGVAQWGRG